MKGVRTSTIQQYKIIVRCEQRDGPPRPSAHHVTGRLKKKKKKKKKNESYHPATLKLKCNGSINKGRKDHSTLMG